MQIVLATSNPHKLEEIRAVFDQHPTPIRWHLLDDVAQAQNLTLTEPVEDQPTFEGNAALKARDYARQTQMICLADDSGLEVDALNGAPGVKSARYSGTQGGRDQVDPANNAKLLEALANTPLEKRTARFVCAMCLATPNDEASPLVVRGTVEGRILLPQEADDTAKPAAGRGPNGFGYDPLFVLPESHAFAGQTTAQLSPDQKNEISHRGEASRLMLKAMQATKLI